MGKTYFIQTFGCQQNVADSEKMSATLEVQGYKKVDLWQKADVVVINTCMVRQMAEDRTYGLVKNINQFFQNYGSNFVKGQESRIKNLDSKFQILDSSNKTKKANNKNNNEKVSYRPRIIVTGCMVGVARADKTGKILARMRERMPGVEFMKTGEILSNTNQPASPAKRGEYYPILTNTNKKSSEKLKAKSEKLSIRKNPLEICMNPGQKIAEKIEDSRVHGNDKVELVVISNGCNNFCTYCVVPFARGREVSRTWEEIMGECRELKAQGVKSVMLLGQNVNSYGSDLVKKGSRFSVFGCQLSDKSLSVVGQPVLKTGKLKTDKPNSENREPRTENWDKPVMVKHLGRYRIPTLFPYLLEQVAQMGFENVNFMSSNPWDFSDELIETIARNKNISRTIHLPVQSGDDEVLKRMNRWYTSGEYLNLVKNLESRIKNLELTTDIIVGFPGETEKQFQHTVDLCRKVKFDKAYISLYSPRPMTAAAKNWPDDVPHEVKKRRWEVLERMINKKSKQFAVGRKRLGN